MATKWKKYMTKEEYDSLPHMGRVMADYWTDWLPKSCKELQAEGRLVPFFDKMGNSLADEQVDLMRQGLSEDMAWEIVKEKIFLPPER